MRVLCGYSEHQRRVQFEGCAGEPLTTITAILPRSKWSRLLLRIVLQDAFSEVDRLDRTRQKPQNGQNWQNRAELATLANTSPHFQFLVTQTQNLTTDTEEGKHSTTQKNQEGKQHQPERCHLSRTVTSPRPKDQWCCSLPLGWYCSPFSPLWQCCFGWCCIPILLWCGAAFTSWVVLLSSSSSFGVVVLAIFFFAVPLWVVLLY